MNTFGSEDRTEYQLKDITTILHYKQTTNAKWFPTRCQCRDATQGKTREEKF